MAMNYVVVKVNKGTVAVAMNINGEVMSYEVNDSTFKQGNRESSVPNCIETLGDVMSTVKESLGKDCFIVAVPPSVYSIVNDMNLFTRMIWSKRMILDKRDFTKEEYAIYKKVFDIYRTVIGRVIFQDGKMTASKHKEGESKERAIWVELNNITYDMAFPKNGPELAVNGDILLLDDEDELPLA